MKHFLVYLDLVTVVLTIFIVINRQDQIDKMCKRWNLEKLCSGGLKPFMHEIFNRSRIVDAICFYYKGYVF